MSSLTSSITDLADQNKTNSIPIAINPYMYNSMGGYNNQLPFQSQWPAYFYPNMMSMNGMNFVPAIAGSPGQQGILATSHDGVNQAQGDGSIDNKLDSTVRYMSLPGSLPFHMSYLPFMSSNPMIMNNGNVSMNAPPAGHPYSLDSAMGMNQGIPSYGFGASDKKVIDMPMNMTCQDESNGYKGPGGAGDDAAMLLLSLHDRPSSIDTSEPTTVVEVKGDSPNNEFIIPLPKRRHSKLRNYNKSKDKAMKNKKVYQCPHCEYSSVRRSNVNMHVRCHTGDRPYQCVYPGCTHRCSQLSNLRAHELTHSSEKIYSCRIDGCRYRTLHVENYNAHQMRKHFDGDDEDKSNEDDGEI